MSPSNASSSPQRPADDASRPATRVPHTPQAPHVAILADDLTGAGDTVVQFVQRGWPGLLQRGPQTPPLGERAALARPLHTRALPDAQAQAVTEQAVRATLDAGIARIYLKIDSTMRGSVAAQLRGALAAWRRVHPAAFVVLCPAYPAMGRTQSQGQLWVNGVALADSPAGRDAVTPVRSSRMAELVPGSAVVPACTDAADWQRALRQAAADGHDVVVAEASTDAHLQALAAAIAALGAQALPTGSAGLALPLAAAWLADSPAGPARPAAAAGAPAVAARAAGTGRVGGAPLLLVVTSANEVSRRQVQALQAHFGARLVLHRPPLAELTGGADTGVATAAPARPSAADGSASPADVVVLQAPADQAPAADAAERAAAGRTVAQQMAASAAGTLQRLGAAALVLVGGDGAEATLDALGVQALQVQGVLQEGVPLAAVLGGAHHGLPIATKAGGFGSEHTLVEVVQSLLRQRSDRET